MSAPVETVAVRVAEPSQAEQVDARAAQEAPFAVVRGVVESVEHLSPSFVRITFGGPELHAIGNPAETFDQRIKLIFPPASGLLPDLSGSGNEWYRDWLTIAETERGTMRTYSIRDLLVTEAATVVVVDFVLHLIPGETGPASTWASRARVGDALLLVAPKRGRLDGGGIEYSPGRARTVLLAGDETAAPAIARILEDSDPATSGIAFIEVPEHGDRLGIDAPPGVEVRWLPRAGATIGTALIEGVLDHLEARSAEADHACARSETQDASEIRNLDAEQLLWETPAYSGLGEPICDPRAKRVERADGRADDLAGTYFWIAGESGTVTTLRRHLVKGLGIDRAQVAFMGYWRRGVAMKG